MNEKSPYAVDSELCGGFSKEKYSKEITVLHQEILNKDKQYCTKRY